ncbi:hypothetical protein NX059_000848 [Plenodomus lindquistii]|nr:hypothetical protein NX059_000848 [Plenodomus lindquistii]
MGQHIQNFSSQGSTLGDFYVTRDSTGSIVLADAKLYNNIFTRVIIDDPVLLRMFAPGAIARQDYLSGGRWPQLQLNCVQHGEARQYIYDALHTISDTLRAEADTRDFGETQAELAADPPARFDLGRLVDLSRFPNGTTLSAEEYRMAPLRDRGAVYNKIQQTFYPGSDPDRPRLNLAKPLERQPLVLPARVDVVLGATNGVSQAEGPTIARSSEEMSDAMRGPSQAIAVVTSGDDSTGESTEPATPGSVEASPLPASNDLDARLSQCGHNTNGHPDFEAQPTPHAEPSHIIKHAPSSSSTPNYGLAHARPSLHERFIPPGPDTMSSTPVAPHFQPIPNGLSDVATAPVAPLAASHAPGPSRSRVTGRRSTAARDRSYDADQGLYPKGKRREAGKALWDKVNYLLPDDASRTKYRTYVQTTRMNLYHDTVARAAFHEELAAFVISMGVVREHNEYAQFLRSGYNKEFHMPNVE